MVSVAAAWFDYDNDGLLDLIVSNYTVWTPEKDIRCQQQGGPIITAVPNCIPASLHRLYHNLGQGRFKDVTEEVGFGKDLGKGMGISIADFNGDGYMDVFANDTWRNFLYINQKNGKFKEDGFASGGAYDEAGQHRVGHG